MNASPHQTHHRKQALKRKSTGVLTASLLALLAACPLYAQDVSEKAQKLADRIAGSGVEMQMNESGQPVFVTKNVTYTLTGNQTRVPCIDPITGKQKQPGYIDGEGPDSHTSPETP